MSKDYAKATKEFKDEIKRYYDKEPIMPEIVMVKVKLEKKSAILMRFFLGTCNEGQESDAVKDIIERGLIVRGIEMIGLMDVLGKLKGGEVR